MGYRGCWHGKRGPVTGLVAGILQTLAEELGDAMIEPAVEALVGLFGKEVVQGHLDAIDVAEAALDAQEAALLRAEPK